MAAPVIRPVTSADVDPILALWRLALPEYESASRPHREPRSSIERKLAWADGLFWLAEQPAEPGSAAIGSAQLLGTIMAGYDGHRGWIYSMAVHPEHRRQGIARQLVSHAEQELESLGCVKVNLQVFGGNEAGAAFWRSCGYAPEQLASFGKILPG